MLRLSKHCFLSTPSSPAERMFLDRFLSVQKTSRIARHVGELPILEEDPPMKKTALALPESLWRQLKIRALDENDTFQHVIVKAATAYLKTSLPSSSPSSPASPTSPAAKPGDRRPT